MSTTYEGKLNADGAKRVVRVELQLAGEGTEQKISEFLRSLGGLS